MSDNDDLRSGKMAKDLRDANVAFPEKLVERFERVAKKLNQDWGRAAAADYLNDLIFPSRPGRRGFPPEVAEEILSLKTLHEERYSYLGQTVLDPFDAMYRDKSGGQESDDRRQGRPQSSEPSIYRTRNRDAGTPATHSKYSAMVSQLLPESVRKTLANRKLARAQSGLSVAMPAPESELEELLLDAESLLEDEHFNSGTALLEQLTTLFPDESPFAYLRLMEVYYHISRPEDYEWVRGRLCEQFGCEKLEWNPQRDQFRENLDRLAESFLIAMRKE